MKLAPVFDYLRKKARRARFYGIHQRPMSAIEAWQLTRLREILGHAREHVPFYRARLGAIDAPIESLDQLREIPILTKRDIAHLPTAEYVDGSKSSHDLWKKTSGTTGMPFSLLINEIVADQDLTDFACYRFMYRNMLRRRTLSDIRIAQIKIRSATKENRFFLPVSEYFSDEGGSMERIAQFRPDVITSYPSILLRLADYLEKYPRTDITPRYIVSFGETLSPHARKRMEEIFRTEVYDRYGLGEIGAVAVECAHHAGMHINSESVIVEIVDENGVPAAEGAYGRVIITDLYNFAMPFIRYDSGDIGTLATDVCPCGLETPRIWIRGRYATILSFPHRDIHHLEFDGALDGYMHTVSQYQVAKKSDSEIVVRIVAKSSLEGAYETALRKSIEEVVGPAVRVCIECVPEIKPAARGKSQILVDESEERS